MLFKHANHWNIVGVQGFIENWKYHEKVVETAKLAENCSLSIIELFQHVNHGNIADVQDFIENWKYHEKDHEISYYGSKLFLILYSCYLNM